MAHNLCYCTLLKPEQVLPEFQLYLPLVTQLPSKHDVRRSEVCRKKSTRRLPVAVGYQVQRLLFNPDAGKNTDFDVCSAHISTRFLFEELQATWFASHDLGRAAGCQKESQEGHFGSPSLLNAEFVFPFSITGDGGG